MYCYNVINGLNCWALPQTPLGCFLVFGMFTIFLKSENFRIPNHSCFLCYLPVAGEESEGQSLCHLSDIKQLTSSRDRIQTQVHAPQGTALVTLSPVLLSLSHSPAHTEKDNSCLTHCGEKMRLLGTRASGPGCLDGRCCARVLQSSPVYTACSPLAGRLPRLSTFI